MSERVPWLVVIGLSLATVLALLVPSPSWLDAIVVMAFCLLAPGFAVVAVIRTTERLVALVALLLTGAPTWALIGTIAAYAGFWHPWGIVLSAAVLMLGLGTLGYVRVLRAEEAFAPVGHSAR